jgi:hopene-associated glycosyltransferase HpnB
MLPELAGALSFLIWLYLLLGRGGFWRIGGALRPAARPAGPLPSVVAVIPARNEAEVVGKAVASLAGQDYRGAFHVVVVDDASEDGTAEAARSAAPPEMLTVIEAPPLPPGWTGKLWALSQGIAEAGRFSPEYLLLTDADIVHAPESLLSLVAESLEGYDLVSRMATLRCESPAESALIPAFVFFFFMLYPPAWVRSPRYRTAAAAGGCILIRRATLERIGGIGRIRGELIDDCALALAIKQNGGRILLELSRDTQSIREYRTFGSIFRMISRTAFTQLRHSPLLLLATAAGMAITFFVPPITTFAGSRFGLAAWLLFSLLYAPMVRFYGCSLLWAPLLPLVAAFYLSATIHSALRWWRGGAGMWKGRAQGKLT